jgi:hypothetical protein
LSESNVDANTHVVATFRFQRAKRGRFKGGVYVRQYFRKGAKVLISRLGSGQVILPGSGRFTPKVRFPVSLESTICRRGKDKKPKGPVRNGVPTAVLPVLSCNGCTRHTFVTKLEPTATTHFFQIHFNIIQIPKPRSPKRYLPLRFSDLNRKCESLECAIRPTAHYLLTS